MTALFPVFIDGQEATPAPPGAIPIMRPYPVFKTPLPVKDRSTTQVYLHMAETWELLARGIYVRLVPRRGVASDWPPHIRGWLSPPSAPPPGPRLKVSVGMFRQFLNVYLEQARVTGEVFAVSYATPARFENEELPMRIRKRPHGSWQAVLS